MTSPRCHVYYISSDLVRTELAQSAYNCFLSKNLDGRKQRFDISLHYFTTGCATSHKRGQFLKCDKETVMLAYSSIIKLKALRAYLDYLKVRGQALNPDSFGTAV
jgi:hypothetical protein